jgi:hypothetical protein
VQVNGKLRTTVTLPAASAAAEIILAAQADARIAEHLSN